MNRLLYGVAVCPSPLWWLRYWLARFKQWWRQ